MRLELLIPVGLTHFRLQVPDSSGVEGHVLWRSIAELQGLERSTAQVLSVLYAKVEPRAIARFKRGKTS